MNRKHMGSNFYDFLRKEQILNAAETGSVKRVIAFQIQRERKQRRLTKTAMAGRTKTSRAELDRLLDPKTGRSVS